MNPRSALIKDNALPLGAVLVSALMLSTGWAIFGDRLDDRSTRAEAAEQQVSRIWGGPLAQPHPSLRWRRMEVGAASLAEAEIGRSDVKVTLDAQYRTRGITEYPTYDAAFEGRYTVPNPSKEPAFVAFSIGLPVQRRALMLRDVQLLVNGKEDPERTTYDAEQIVWTGRMEGGMASLFTVKYRARGLGSFGYRFATPAQQGADGSPQAPTIRPVTAFRMAMQVNGAKGALDFPVGSMSPTSSEVTPGAATLVWDVDRLLSAMDVGVVLPDSRGAANALRRLTGKAGWFYLLYGGALLFALAQVGRKARALHILGLSAAYFLYFPLATYLSAYLPWLVACTVSLAGISAPAITHVRRFVGGRSTVLVSLAQLFCLVVPAAAHLVPAHTGLILVLSGFVGLAVGLHLVGHAARRVRDEERAPSPMPAGAVASW